MVYKIVQQSALIKPAATLGAVNSGSRVSLSRLGSEHFLTAYVGSSFHVYDCDDLQLQYLSRPLKGSISALLTVADFTIVSVGAEILIFHKMVVIATHEGHTSAVERMSSIGDSLLVSVGGREVLAWKLPRLSKNWSGEEAAIVKPECQLGVDFQVTSMIPVPTYVNKMLIGGSGGEVELWNLKRFEKVYSFKSLSNRSSVSALASAPVLDVVGVGFSDGSISIVNMKLDEVLISLNQSEHGSVTSLSFRKDAVGGQLVSGTNKGDLVVWDLNKRMIHSFLQSVHPGGVGTVEFLDTLPLMVTSGVEDNAISIYLFDKPDQGCRLLKERRGFTGAFGFLLPYSEHDLIVGSQSGEVGKLNLIQSHQNKVWSQSTALGSQISEKPWKCRHMHSLPQVTSVSSCQGKLRHFDWPNVATTHKGLPEAYLWSAHQQALVTRMLIVPRKSTTGSRPPEAVSVAVSPCGNYAALGLDNGEVHRFNLQSCYHRGLVMTAKTNSSIVGMHFISSRDVVIASSESLEVWKIVPRPVQVASISCVAKNIAGFSVHGYLCAVWHRDSEMGVSIVDMHADKLVRRVMLTESVSAVAWAEGGKWLAIATADKRMVVYDLPTAGVIDRVEFSSTVLSIVFVHGNAKLVTAHEDGRGSIRVWQNLRFLQQHKSSSMEFKNGEFVKIDEFTPHQEVYETEKDSAVPFAFQHNEEKAAEEDGMISVWQEGSRTRWQQILKLDEIKQRNKVVKGIVQNEKSAPFFLPVKYQGVAPVFVAPPPQEQEAEVSGSGPQVKKLKQDLGFIDLVEKGTDFDKIRSFLLNSTPSGVHVCIAQLDDSEKGLENFLKFLAAETEAARNMDLVAAWTAIVVKMHHAAGSFAQVDPQVVGSLQIAAKQIAQQFDQQTNQVQCLLKVTAALQLHR